MQESAYPSSSKHPRWRKRSSTPVVGQRPRDNSLLSSQLTQNLFPQLLRLAEKFLILDEQPVQVQRLIRRELLAQNHVAYMNRVRQGRIFGQFFQRGIGIVMIHAGIVAPVVALASRRRRYTNSVLHRSCRCTIPLSFPPPSTTISDVIFFSSIRASSVAANSPAAIVRGFFVMHSPAVKSSTSFPRFSRSRRKSPSLMTPTSLSPSTTAVTPSFLRDIS